MSRKIIKILIYIVISLIVILLLAYGVSESDFNNLKKYDQKDSIRTTLQKSSQKKERTYTTEVEIQGAGMASLGDFTLSISNNRQVHANISLKYEDKKERSWIGTSSIEQEIIDKGNVLRGSVIRTIANSNNANISNNAMKKRLIKNLNNNLSDAKIENIYFNKFVIE
ncbi:MAG: flagellar basal body-associated FliL family protein [Campylobacterota bacterium]|nr:flagellar basal body-associated FliL family protein [Campylobacterota bacterium]